MRAKRRGRGARLRRSRVPSAGGDEEAESASREAASDDPHPRSV